MNQYKIYINVDNNNFFTLIYAVCIAIFQRYYSRFFENHFIYHIDIKGIITVSSLNLSVSQNSFIRLVELLLQNIPAAKCLIVIRASMNYDMKVLYSFFFSLLWFRYYPSFFTWFKRIGKNHCVTESSICVCIVRYCIIFFYWYKYSYSINCIWIIRRSFSEIEII